MDVLLATVWPLFHPSIKSTQPVSCSCCIKAFYWQQRDTEARRDTASLAATEHSEDPDSPRSPAAPTAAAALLSAHPAQSPGYHSNSTTSLPSSVTTLLSSHARRWQSGAGCTRRGTCAHSGLVSGFLISQIIFLSPTCFRCVFLRTGPSRL